MLVLTRKVGEKIRVGDDIVITLIHARGGHAQVGIDAPPGLRIWREGEAADSAEVTDG